MDNRLLDNYLGKTDKKMKISSYITKILMCFIILMSSLIYTKISDKNLINFKKNIFDNSFDFMDFKKMYETISGKKDNIKEVFSENIYYDVSDYLDGEQITVNKDELIKTISSGIVVFIGNKEGYNNSIIIQGSDGFDILYGNLESVNVKIYDYIDLDKVIGSASDKLYLLISKDGKKYKYEDYKNQVS